MTNNLGTGTAVAGIKKFGQLLWAAFLLGTVVFFVFWAVWWLWPPDLFTKLLDVSFWLPNILGVHGEPRYQHNFFGTFADGTPLYGISLMPDMQFVLYFLGLGLPWATIVLLVKR